MHLKVAAWNAEVEMTMKLRMDLRKIGHEDGNGSELFQIVSFSLKTFKVGFKNSVLRKMFISEREERR
jgi:hypothetical protein